MTVIDSFSGKHEFLSNFFACNIVDPTCEIKFPTSEHFFQSRKTHNMEEKIKIALCETPGQAKRMGKKITLRPDWETAKKEIMMTILHFKFEQHPRLAEKLISTGDDFLIEGNQWHDMIWGKCFCEEHKGQGENALGILLMKLRRELQDEAKRI